MPCYKDEKTELGIASFDILISPERRSKSASAASKPAAKRRSGSGNFHLQKAKSCDMTLASFVELYFNDREHHVRDTTMDTKRNIF